MTSSSSAASSGFQGRRTRRSVRIRYAGPLTPRILAATAEADAREGELVVGHQEVVVAAETALDAVVRAAAHRVLVRSAGLGPLANVSGQVVHLAGQAPVGVTHVELAGRDEPVLVAAAGDGV